MVDIRILSFYPSPPESEGFSGGIRRFFEIVGRWISLGNEIYLVGHGDICKLESVFRTKIHVKSYKFFRLGVGLGNFINVRRMLREIPEEHFDLVYCPGEEYIQLLVSIFARKKLRVPLVGCVNALDKHETSVLRFIKGNFLSTYAYRKSIFRCLYWALISGFQTLIRNLLLKKMDLILAVSDDIKTILQGMGLEKKRICVVSGGVDYCEIQSISQKEKEYDACFLGRITPMKGVSDLVVLWKYVTEINPNMKLLIIGSGTLVQVKRIKRLIEYFNLQKNIVMSGFIFGKRKYDLLKKSKIFIFPSYSEGFAQAICEAMACGLPVIAYDLPSYKEWYGEDIIYVKTGDLKELFKKTLQLLRNEAMCKQIGKNGRKRVKKYSWDSVSDYELKIVNETLAKK